MERDPYEKPNYDDPIHFEDTDDEDQTEGSLMEVSEETKKFLTEKCTWSVLNSIRRKTRSRYPLPKVAATKTPQLDPFMRSGISAGVKTADKELAKIQTFMLDAMAPLATICMLEKESMSARDTRNAVVTAVELLGNANARVSRLRRERVVLNVNKALLPLVQEDTNFDGASPALFGSDFAKRSKDYVDQVKAMRSVVPAKTQDNRQFFRGGPPNKGGNNKLFRGGGPNKYRGGRDRHQFPRTWS